MATCPSSSFIRAVRRRGVRTVLIVPAMPTDPDDHETEAERRTANIILLVGAAVIIGGGIWLVNAMVDSRKSEQCLESGRRNCAPIARPDRN